MWKAIFSCDRLGLIAIGCLGLMPFPAQAQDQTLGEQTRLRLSVLQFMPQTGQYTRWDALSGELVVGAGGVVTVPVIGSVVVGNLTPDELSRDIAARMQSRLGLIEPPDAMIEIISYPPIYVVGSVEQPGEYSFRPGMTVLQALALGGGQMRSETSDSSASDRLRLLAEAQSFERGISRTSLRIARLEADLADKLNIDPPSGSDNDNLVQENAVLVAAQTARNRQIASLKDLQTLYQQEISVLEIRITDLEKTIANTESEFAGVERLVAGGMATVSRRSELERLLSSLRSDRLEQKTAIMRARQYMTEAERNADGIEDTRRTSLTEQLLIERATLEQMTLNASTTKALLANLDREMLLDGGAGGASEPALGFVIVRNMAGKIVELAAGDTEILRPADVVKVSMIRPGSAASPSQ